MPQQRPIGFWVKLLDQLISQQFDALITEHGVTRRQWQVLNLLSNSPRTPTELAVALAPFLSDPQSDSLADEVAGLVRRDWVKAEQGSDGDELTLTERGRASCARLSEVVARSRTTVAAGVSPQEYVQTLQVLERMARNLGWQDPGS